MEIQAFAIILFIITLHILVLNTSGYKEGFRSSKIKNFKFNCGDCFKKKTKSQCVKSLTGKFCNIPCKWSKTTKHHPDGSRSVKHFCEENNPFYKIRRIW
jgi:hypothetical protein